MKHNPAVIIPDVITRYQPALIRLARRIVVQKDRANDVVKWAMEAVYDGGKFYDGPDLRTLLIEKTISMALSFNRALDIYNKVKLIRNYNRQTFL